MATETLNVSGLSASDSGNFSGNVTDIDEAVGSADGNVMSSSTNGEGETLRVALTDVVSVTDGDTVSNVSVTLRCSAPGTGNNSFDVELFIGGTSQGSANTGQVTGSLANYSGLNNAGWNSDWTAAQLNGAEILITCAQNGKGVNTQYNVDCLDVIVTYSAGPSETLEHYRFTVDNNSGSTTGFSHESATDFPFATGSAEDTAWTSAELDTTYCLVAKVYNSGGATSGSIHQLEFRVDTGGGFGSWTTCNGSSTPVQITEGSDDDLASSAVERLSATAAATYKESSYEETAGNCSLSLAADQDGEAHYSLQFLSSGLSGGDDIEFRINNTSDSALVTNTVTPSVTISAGTPQQNANMSGVGTVGLTLLKSFQRSYSISGTGSSAITKAVGWLRSFTGTGSVVTSASRTFLKSLAYAATGSLAFAQNAVIDRILTYAGTGAAVLTRAVTRARSFAYTGTGTATRTTGPRVWLNSTPDLTGSPTAMTVTSYNDAGTSITFSDPSGAPTGSLYLIVENVSTGEIGSIAVTVTETGGTYTGTFSGTGATTLTKELRKALAHSGTGASTLARITDRLRSFTYSGTGTQVGEQVRVTLLDLNYTGTGTASTPPKQVGKPLTHSGTGSLAVARSLQLTKSLAFAGTGASTIAKGLGKSLSFAGTGALATTAQLTFLVSAAMSGTGAVTLTKQIGKTLAAAASGAVQIAKETGKALAYTANGALAALQAASYVSAFSYSGVGSVASQQDLGLQEQNLNFTGTGTVTRGPWVFGKYLPYTGFGVPTQENDGTPITTGFTIGDDNWWRWRRIMFKRNRARFKRNK